MDKVYIETSIVSHAAARPSQDVTVAGLQQQALGIGGRMNAINLNWSPLN